MAAAAMPHRSGRPAVRHGKKGELVSTVSKIVPFGSGSRIVETACRTLSVASQGLNALEAKFSDRDFAAIFLRVAGMIMSARGRLIVTGMGKSGIVARKMTATLTSTGTPAQFVHPAEASHGDLGMIVETDCVLAISRSGETAELSDLLYHCRRIYVPVIGMTFKPGSSLAKASTAALVLPECGEASEEAPAPTTSRPPRTTSW